MSFSNIINESIRFFVFQSKDMATMPELQAGYTTAILIDKLGMNQDRIRVQSCYPYETFFAEFNANINSYPEEIYFFFLENFYHSSSYASKELVQIVSKIKNKRIIVQSSKISEYDAIRIMTMLPSIELVIRTDPEYVIYQQAVNKVSIQDVANVVYRENGVPTATKHEDVSYPLSDYIFPAYTNGKLLKDKDTVEQICRFVDPDNERTDPRILYNQPRRMQIEMLHRDDARRVAMLTSGRGCKYKCSYCFRGVKYSSVRQIPLDVVEADLAYLKANGFNRIYFYDDCFVTTNRDRIDEIIGLMQKYDFSYYIAIRYEACNPEILERLSVLTFYRVQIGLQSIKHNAAHKRSFNHEKLVQAVSRLKKANAVISIDLILGLPGETKEDFKNTVQYAISLSPAQIVVNTLFLNPGTELYSKANDFGIKVNPNISLNVPYLVESSTFPAKDLAECKEWLKGLCDSVRHIGFLLR